MEQDNTYIRFDWAIKHMLRDKANFDILEGFISVLLGEEVHIVELLESESNQDSAQDKSNRVDIMAKNSKGNLIIVEVQPMRQLHYLQRILYGTCKTNTEHINIGDKYDQVRKVYSIRVNSYDKIPETPLDEWMAYLKTGKVKENTQAPGLQQVKKKLQYLSMTPSERRNYDAHMDNIMFQNDVLETAHLEGWSEGFAVGLAEGREVGIAEVRNDGVMQGISNIALNLISLGTSDDVIMQATGLSADALSKLRSQNK